MRKNLKRKTEVKFFSSFEEENKQEYERRKNMTAEERIREFAILQERRWGADWTTLPILKKVSFEKPFTED